MPYDGNTKVYIMLCNIRMPRCVHAGRLIDVAEFNTAANYAGTYCGHPGMYCGNGGGAGSCTGRYES